MGYSPWKYKESDTAEHREMMEEEEKFLWKEIFLKLKEPVLAGMEKMFPWLQIFICGRIMVKPILMLFLAKEQVDVDAVGMFKSILIVTIGPVTIGFLLNHFFGEKKTYKNLMGVMPAVAVICLALIVGGVSAKYGKDFLHSGWLIMLAVFLHNTLGYIAGYLAGLIFRFTRSKNRTISIEVGMQNAGLATVLAGKHFPTMPAAAVICAVSCVWHSITGAFLAYIFNWIDKLFEKRQES